MGGSRAHTAAWSWTDTARVALESVLVVRPPRQAAVVGMSGYGLRGAAWRLPQWWLLRLQWPGCSKRQQPERHGTVTQCPLSGG